MVRWFLVFIFVLFGICQAQQGKGLSEKTDFPDRPDKATRMLELLPYVVHPPLVDPYLPKHFTLGSHHDDTYFSQGYYWGYQKNLDEYFAHNDALSGCLIRAQMSTSVKQLGVDRFSCDRNPNELTAAGFTGVRMNHGKWGIFPYRELQARGPKGRWYYQLWVGLNTAEGATIYFQLIYPTFLNEPTQSQKKVWSDFVHKTGLLNHEDIMIAHGLKMGRNREELEKEYERVAFSVEKRKKDQKFLIRVQVVSKEDITVQVQSVHDSAFFMQGLCSEPYVEIESIFCTKELQEVNNTRVFYTLVDEFSFEADLLSVNRLEECGHALIVH